MMHGHTYIKLLTYLNSALKGLLRLDIFPRVLKKKLNFVVQCYLSLLPVISGKGSIERNVETMLCYVYMYVEISTERVK